MSLNIFGYLEPSEQYIFILSSQDGLTPQVYSGTIASASQFQVMEQEAASARRRKMQYEEFEYHIEHSASKHPLLVGRLNELGSKGWQLVSQVFRSWKDESVGGSYATWDYTFIRKKRK